MPNPAKHLKPVARAVLAAQFDMSARLDDTAAADADAVRFAFIPVLPQSGTVGRDGRGPFTYQVGEFVRGVNSQGADVPVFVDHMPGRAVGWLDHNAPPVVHPDGSVEWPVEYTAEGLELLKSKAYRYCSPTWWVMQDPSITDRQAGRIVGLQEVSLTNLPNQPLRALNSQNAGAYTGQQTTLPVLKQMNAEQLALLGLTAEATAEQITAALTSLSANAARALAIVAEAGAAADAEPAAVVEAAAQSRVTSGALVSRQALDEAVAARDLALSAQSAAEAALAAVKAEQAQASAQAAEAAATAAVDAAIASGKFTPAVRELCLNQARADLSTFQALANALPVHPAAAAQAVATQAVQGDNNFGLSAEQLAKCKQHGIEPAEYAKALRATKAAA